MNNCNNCNKKRVCKHYDYLLSNASTFKVTNIICDEQELSTSVSLLTVEQEPLKPINVIKDLNKDLNTYNATTNININPDFRVTAEPTELAECFNENCKAKTYIEDRSMCSKCGIDVCPSCSFMHIDYNPKQDEEVQSSVLCESCWSKLDIGTIDEMYKEKEPIQDFSFDIKDYIDDEEESKIVNLEIEESKVVDNTTNTKKSKISKKGTK